MYFTKNNIVKKELQKLLEFLKLSKLQCEISKLMCNSKK